MKPFSSITISIIFACLLLLIPWDDIRNAAFIDKAVYLDYAYYQVNVLEYRDFDAFYSYISFEWLWHFLILHVGDYIAYETFFNLISFMTLTAMSYFITRRHGPFSLILLMNPLVIDLAMSQYRISLALVIVVIASIINKHKIISITLTLIATLIHSSVVLFIAIYLAIIILGKVRFKQKYFEVIFLSFLGLILSFLLSDFVSVILEAIGDRRSGNASGHVNSSLSYLSFWILNAAIVIFNFYILGVNKIKDKITIVILSLIAGHSVFGGYSTRILAVFLPVIMSTNLDLSRQPKILLFAVYFLYTALQWNYWLA